MRTRHAAAAGLLTALLIAGCGSSSSTSSSSSGGRTYGPLTPATAPKPVATPRPTVTHRRTAARSTTTMTAAAPPARLPPEPPIVQHLIPFGPTRLAETEAYVRRHYGSFTAPTWRLRSPHVIVIHYTDASLDSTFSTFSADAPDSELHELPGTCAHFVIGTDGTIYQVVPVSIICRHTVGLNWTAIGIEHVGFSDAEVLGDSRQLTASLRLVDWLRCRFGISVDHVIGHNESLSSPYHHEDVASLRTQTHGDFNRADMDVYRADLRRHGTCATA